MNKNDYMNTLKQELAGLPAEVIEDTLWSYEGKFVDAMLAGREESAYAAGLPKPHLVAAQRRAALRYQKLKTNVSPAKFAGLLVAFLGLLVFNFLMLLPAIIYSGLLFSAYIASLFMYVAGIAITAASLAGVPQIHFELSDARYFVQELADMHNKSAVKVDISAAGMIIDGLNAESDASQEVSVASQHEPRSVLHVSIGDHLNDAQLSQGLGLILASICLWMLSLCMTRYSLIGIKRYLGWNFSLLQSAGTT